MLNSNHVLMTIGGTEYTLSLTRKGVQAIEKYTKISSKKDELEKIKKTTEYVDEIKVGDDPFADIDDDVEEKLNANMETMKRILWILLWDEHKLNIEEVRELLIKILDENKIEELNANITKLIEGANKEMNGGDYLKNMKALKAQK